MAKIHNTDLFKELKDGAKLQQAFDVVPDQIADKVVPVMEVNPKLLRRTDLIRHTSSTASGTTTLFTTSAVKDTFITFVSFSYVKDAACDAATGRLTVNITVGGTAREIIGCSLITTTAQSDSARISFPEAIKADRNTAITMTGTFTAGNLIRTLCVGGYEVDNPNA